VIALSGCGTGFANQS